MYTNEEILRRKRIRAIRARQRKFKRNVFFAVVSILMLSLAFSGVFGDKITETQYITVSVDSGDTLWSIAKEHTDGDVRNEIVKIKKANNMKTSDLESGQILKIPVD